MSNSDEPSPIAAGLRTADRATTQRRTRILASILSLAINIVVIAALLLLRSKPQPNHPIASPIFVELAKLPAPVSLDPEGGQQTPPNRIRDVEPPKVRPTILPDLRPAESEPTDTSDLLSDAQLVGAANADGGSGGNESGGGNGCNTAAIVQSALQRDPQVIAAVTDAHRLGKSIILWNGDWVRSGGQDGKGLSAVREAIMWELAFAPEPCRNKREHGLILLSLADGNTRFAIGSNDWRWVDLLNLQRGPPRP